MTNDEIIALMMSAFQPISAIHTDGAAADTDMVLFLTTDSSNNLVSGKMSVNVLRAYLTKVLNPTINSSGYWVIGSTVTSIKAEGVTPVFRKGTNGIEVSTDKGGTYETVALWADLRPDYASMTTEQLAAFKLTFSDLTDEEKEELKGDKGDPGAGIVGIEKTSTNGLIDTYTITFDDGSTKTYTVTNGADLEFNWQGTQLGVRVKGTTTYTYVDLIGEKGNTGVGIQSIALTSTDGLEDTYTITLTDATTTTFVVKNGSVWTIGEDLYWYKDGVKTEYYSQGPKGNTGKSGVQVSSEEPTDPDVNVWIKSNGTADLSLKDYSNEINVDKIYPLASGYYTLATAIAAIVDESLRKTGVKITFQSAAGIFETWQFKSVIANWSTTTYWEKLYTNTPAQLFAAVALTNPYLSVTPREIGDIAINSTTKEIWTAIATNASVDSWELSSQGTYGGTLITDVYSITKNGFYSITSTGQHVPTSDESFYILALCSNLSTTSAVLTVIGLTSGKMYMIRKVNSVWGNYIGGVTQTELSYMIGITSNVQTQLNNLQLGDGKYYIGGWNPDDLSPVPTTRIGDQTWMRNVSGIYLFDMTLNTGDVMYPVGELNRANWLRFADGTFAPTIGITEAMRATCDVALYLDNAQATLYSAAGSFNAATFYNAYGMSQKLYDGSGNEVRILRPWETTETKYHIGFAFREKVWLIDGLGDSGKYWNGLSQHEITWDGVKGVPLEKTAFSPGPATSVGNKMRNFFFLYNTGDSNTASASGQSGLCTLFSGLNRQFPRVNDVSQITNMNYARANNPVTTNSYPVAEGGYHTLNSIISRAEVLYNTRYLHNPSLFGSGISSNDTCNSEVTFLANGGFKYKKSVDSTWSYCTFGATPTMYYNGSGGTTNASAWSNGQYAKEQCLESQMAASFAKETGISQNTDFTFYGNTYQYRNVTGVLGLADGYMNVIVTKVLSQTISAFDNSGTATNYDISCCLRMSVIDGVNLLGDIFEYSGGGYEQVGTNISTTQPHVGDTFSLYIQPDQRKWHNDSTVSKNSLGVFDFEKVYTKVGSVVTVGDNYAKKRLSLTPYKILNGGNIATGLCYYQNEGNYWSIILQQRVRGGARFRGYAISGACSPRSMAASYAVSTPNVHSCGSAQILMG